MASVITDHPPQELAAELGALLRVDWRAVWAGIPEGDSERAEWCARFGWQPLWLQSGLWVRTLQSGRLHLTSSGVPGAPVTGALFTAWRVRADSTSEGTDVTAVALDRYAAHLAQVTTALGPLAGRAPGTAPTSRRRPLPTGGVTPRTGWSAGPRTSSPSGDTPTRSPR